MHNGKPGEAYMPVRSMKAGTWLRRTMMMVDSAVAYRTPAMKQLLEDIDAEGKCSVVYK